MNFLYFLAYIFKKNMTFAASADKSEARKICFREPDSATCLQ